MPIRCVAFDADDTLWDFTTAMRGGLDRAVEVATAARADLRDRLEAGAMEQRWIEVYEHHKVSPRRGERLGDLRGRSIASTLADHGAPDELLAEQMTNAYFAYRHGEVQLHEDAVDLFDLLGGQFVLGLVTNGTTDPEASPLAGRFDFRLAADEVGIAKPDRRMFLMAAAAAGCHPAELAYVGDDPENDVAAPQAAGCRGIWLNRTGATLPPGIAPDAVITTLSELPDVLASMDADEAAEAEAVGVGPHLEPWPDDDRLDLELLAAGDRRNVVDRYRYWSEAAIVADLDMQRHPFHVAVENWRHDRNIGAVVRNANAFGAAGVHIIGRRRWNRRGAMATDRYLTVHHHDTVATFVAWADQHDLTIVGIDNVDGSVPLESVALPERSVLVFGQEGPGLSPEVLERAAMTCAITQYGSTRSINAGVASGIAMHAWVRAHGGPGPSGS